MTSLVLLENLVQQICQAPLQGLSYEHSYRMVYGYVKACSCPSEVDTLLHGYLPAWIIRFDDNHHRDVINNVYDVFLYACRVRRVSRQELTERVRHQLIRYVVQSSHHGNIAHWVIRRQMGRV